MAMFDVDGDLVRKLAGLLQETGLTDIEVADGDKRMRVSRAGMVAPAVVAAPAMSAPASTSAPSAPAKPSSDNALTSPMVGTAYVAADPKSPPFVKVGDMVKVGQTLLIIEAMKVMNPIKASKAGTVTQIFVANAQPVEFGEPLMVIE